MLKFLICILLLACASLAKEYKIAAIVDKEAITWHSIDEAARAIDLINPGALQEMTKDQLRDKIILDKIKLKYAQKINMNISDDIIKNIADNIAKNAANGKTTNLDLFLASKGLIRLKTVFLEQVKTEVVWSNIQRNISEEVAVSDAEVQAFKKMQDVGDLSDDQIKNLITSNKVQQFEKSLISNMEALFFVEKT